MVCFEKSIFWNKCDLMQQNAEGNFLCFSKKVEDEKKGKKVLLQLPLSSRPGCSIGRLCAEQQRSCKAKKLK